MRVLLLLLLLPLVLATIFLSPPCSAAYVDSAPRKALLGGWKPIKNLSDPHVREIADFAVSEHNKEANARLLLGRVIRGETQAVSGVNYRLVVEASDGAGEADKYEAVVWEKAWEGFRRLTSFKPVKA